jgi:hypothetical protein
MLNKINKERQRSMNATHTTQQQEPMARNRGVPVSVIAITFVFCDEFVIKNVHY